MTNSVRRLAVGASVLLALSLLMACGDDDNGGGGTNPTPTPTVMLGATPVPTVEFCAQAPSDQLCSFLPHDVIAPNLGGTGYSQLGAAEQRPFDTFSWQTFVALNWPAERDGTPIGDSIAAHPDAPRVWNSYATSLEAFGVDVPGGLSSRPSVCAALGEDLPILQTIAKSGDIHREPAAILQATETPLIDRNLNFVLYDIRLNPVEQTYITTNGLNTMTGQAAFKQSGAMVSFPLGSYADDTARTGGSVGAIEIKSAWRILDTASGDQPDRFYTMQALIYVAASASASGEAFCFPATLGLVGVHIIERTSGPRTFGLDWIWATFEHVDNAPLAQNPGDPTSFSPAPAPCTASASDSARYSFFNQACTGSNCPTNTVPAAQPGVGYQWAATPPYARQYAINNSYGTQVVRCWDIYGETEELNAAFRAKLAGTVWANYRLVNTQWQGGIENPTSENGNIPRFLGNAVLETTIQNSSSCLQCHAYATTTAGQDANFSFLLGLAH